MYGARRDKLLSAMGEGVAVFPSTPVTIRNNDVENDFRQDSDLYYLTGFAEPESVLVVTNRHPEHRGVMFLRERDPKREVWDGPRLGVDRAVGVLGIDAAFPIAQLDEHLPGYLENASRLHYRIGRDPDMDDHVLRAIADVRRRARHGVAAPTEIVDPSVTVHEMRLRKEPVEIDAMRRALEVTCEAHLAAMRVAKPGRYEYEVEAEILRVFRSHGCERPAYGSIVGSGPNATVLHYRTNDRRMEDGDLLLIDAGCEHGYVASDVTRTFPISGRFTEEQRAVYGAVLDAQRAACEAIRPGVTVEDVHRVAVRRVTEGLTRMGLLEGDVDRLIEEEEHKAFFMHRTSHWIGMDVHDVGAYFVDGSPRPLEPGFVLTVEPGIYVAEDADVDPRWRGIGVRIEDDVLVTGDGHEVLSASIPKDPDGIERVLADR